MKYKALHHDGRWYVVPHWERVIASNKQLTKHAVYSCVRRPRCDEKVRKLNRLEAAKEVISE